MTLATGPVDSGRPDRGGGRRSHDFSVFLGKITSDDHPSGAATYSQAGAQFGYSLN
jgi:hypothetical protein